MFMELKFNLKFTWFDHQVLWMNLKKNTNLNILSKEEIGLLWMPKLVFANADTIQPMVYDESAIVSVQRRTNGKVLLYPDETNEEMYFNSSENPLQYQRDYQQKFYCDFNFRWYPFDTQECGVKLEVFNSMSDTVGLKAGSLDYSGEPELLQFVVIGWDIHKNEGNGIVEAKLTFQRNFSNHFATTFLPSFCLLLISLCTVYFKKDHFRTSVPVNITTMLGTDYLIIIH